MYVSNLLNVLSKKFTWHKLYPKDKDTFMMYLMNTFINSQISLLQKNEER